MRQWRWRGSGFRRRPCGRCCCGIRDVEVAGAIESDVAGAGGVELCLGDAAAVAVGVSGLWARGSVTEGGGGGGSGDRTAVAVDAGGHSTVDIDAIDRDPVVVHHVQVAERVDGDGVWAEDDVVGVVGEDSLQRFAAGVAVNVRGADVVDDFIPIVGGRGEPAFDVDEVSQRTAPGVGNAGEITAGVPLPSS